MWSGGGRVGIPRGKLLCFETGVRWERLCMMERGKCTVPSDSTIHVIVPCLGPVSRTILSPKDVMGLSTPRGKLQ